MHEFIAEIGTSHGGSLPRAQDLIDAARESGATCAKFQWVIADEIVSSRAGRINLPNGSSDIYAYFKSVEMPPDFYAEVKERVEKAGMRFLCSVFGAASLEHLLRLNPKAIKIASPEVNHIPLLARVREHAVDVVLSGGIASYSDMLRAVDFLRAGRVQNVQVLSCVTKYPAPLEAYRPDLLPLCRALFSCACGLSDHTTNAAALPALFAAYGGVATEKHITLNKPAAAGDAACPDDPIALTPDEFARMVQATARVAQVYEAHGETEALAAARDVLGDEDFFALSVLFGLSGRGEKNAPAQSAQNNAPNNVRERCAVLYPHYCTTRRSMFAARDMKAGDILTEASCTLLRSEHNIAPGIPSEAYGAVIGQTLKKNIAQGESLRYEHLL